MRVEGRGEGSAVWANGRRRGIKSCRRWLLTVLLGLWGESARDEAERDDRVLCLYLDHVGLVVDDDYYNKLTVCLQRRNHPHLIVLGGMIVTIEEVVMVCSTGKWDIGGGLYEG